MQGVNAGASRCGIPDVERALLARYRTVDGRCVRPVTALGVRCGTGSTPLVVRRLGGGRSVLYLGGRFAVPVRTVPPDGVTIGVTASERLLLSGGQLYVEASGSLSRWLALSRSTPTSTGAPDAAMIGDSILDGARDVLPAALPRWRITLDAEIGRPSSGGPALVPPIVARAPDVVVIELGTNDEDPVVFRANTEAMLSALADVPLVLWLVPHAPSMQIAAVGRELREAVSAYPNTVAADWDAFVPEDALLDGVHLLPERQDVFTGFLASYLSEWLAVVRGRGPARCLDEVRAAVLGA